MGQGLGQWIWKPNVSCWVCSNVTILYFEFSEWSRASSSQNLVNLRTTYIFTYKTKDLHCLVKTMRQVEKDTSNKIKWFELGLLRINTEIALSFIETVIKKTCAPKLGLEQMMLLRPNRQYQTKGIYWTFKNLFSFGPWISMRNFSPKDNLFGKF